jgi:SPP1 gp7 family putative phage head morphogenesis protein
MSLNDRLLHHAIGHHVRVQRYGASAQNDYQKILDDGHDQVRQLITESSDVIESQNTDTKDFAELLAAILAILDDTKAALQAQLEQDLQDFAENEADNEIAVLEGESDLNLIVPSNDQLDSVISDVAFQGRYLETWVDDLIKGDMSRIQASIISGMQRGDNALTIAATLTLGYITTANWLNNLVRTIWNGTSNWIRLLVMQANGDVIGQVQWHATLDEVTCPICAELDGQVFNVDEIEPPPAHPSCRCFITAVFASGERMAASRRHGKKFSRMASAHREHFTGKAPQKMRYVTWLRNQPVDVQNEALGPTRARLFRLGKLSISKFVSDRRHILTLAQLRKRDAAAFRRAGLTRKPKK